MTAKPDLRRVPGMDLAVDAAKPCYVAVTHLLADGRSEELRFEPCSAAQALRYAAGDPSWRDAPGEAWPRRLWRRITR